MITLTRRCLPFFLLFLLFSLSPSRLPAQTDKVTTTPFLLQQGFGPGGSLLPGDGANYCQPTSIASSLLWLHDNGYDRLFEQPFAAESTNHANLVRALGGLMRTSARGGTSILYAKAGLETYLGLKGYAGFGVTDYDSGYYDPASEMDLDFLQEQNTGYNVVNLAYRWGLTRDGADQDVGGHAVTLLKSDPDAGELVIGNPAPFVKGGNPETHPVQSISFAGQENVLAIDFSSAIPRAQVWGILASAIVVSPDELPGGGGAATPWVLDTDQWINTNGAYLTADAPITSAAGVIYMVSLLLIHST